MDVTEEEDEFASQPTPRTLVCDNYGDRKYIRTVLDFLLSRLYTAESDLGGNGRMALKQTDL